MGKKYSGYVFKLKNSYDPIIETFGTTLELCRLSCENIFPRFEWETVEQYDEKLSDFGKFVKVTLTLELE